MSERLVAEHKAKVDTRPGGHTKFALMDGQHPIQPERDMHLTRHAVIAANIGRDLKE